MSSHFACIGFPLKDMADYERLKRRAAAAGTPSSLPSGRALVRWEIGGGPEIWMLTEPNGEVAEATPFHRPAAPLRLALTGSGEDADDDDQGWVEGWVEPVEPDEPISGAFPLRLDLVNYALVRETLRTGRILSCEICAIAHEGELAADEDAFNRTRGAQYRPPARSVVSAAHFGADEPEGAGEAAALVTGIVEDAERLVNRETGAPYWLLRVQTEKVALTVCADRETLPADPAAGSVLSASCWMLGRALGYSP